MIKRIKRNKPTVASADTSSVARSVRSLAMSLAVPALMTACASVPHGDSGSLHSTDAGSKTVLIVGPGGGRLDDGEKGLAESKDAPSSLLATIPQAEQYGPPAPLMAHPCPVLCWQQGPPRNFALLMKPIGLSGMVA